MNDVVDVLMYMYPGACFDATPGGDCIVLADGAPMYWPAALCPQPSMADIQAFADGPVYLAHVKAQRIAFLDAERLPRLEAAGWTPAWREDAMAGIPSAATQAHLLSERQAVAGAFVAASNAIKAAATVAEVEAVEAQWPNLTGPDGAQ